MKIKNIFKKGWFWAIVILLILFTTLIIFSYILMNIICWSAVIEGYKNIETGECEKLTGCFKEEIDEGYIFDEACWADTQSSRYWEQTKLERCEELCNKNLCPEGTLCYPVCNLYC